MSSESANRPELLASLARELRRLGDQDVLFTQTLAERLNIHPTDFRGLSTLMEAGLVTAGHLADLLGLTTGAVTSLMDRLEKAGFIRRVKDPADRRHVLLEVVPERREQLLPLFDSYAQGLARLSERWDDAHLKEIIDFVGRTAGLIHDEAARLRSNGGAPGATGDREGELSAPIGTHRRAVLRIPASAQFTVRGDATQEELYRARFKGRVPTVQVDADGVVSIKYGRFAMIDWRRVSATLTLSGRLPWELELRGGVWKLDADLTGLPLRGITITGGASEVRLVLPVPDGPVPIRITGGASQLHLIRPAGTAARLELRGGVSALSFDGQRFGSVGGRVKLDSTTYSGALDRYELEVTGGASDLEVEAR